MANAKVTPHHLPILASVRVASPCQASWTEMVGDRRSRFCVDCQTQVFNLSDMSREQAERLVIERNGDLCARYYQRADGTVLTADCKIGAHERKRSGVVAAAGIAALMIGGGAVAGHAFVDSTSADPLPALSITGDADAVEVEVRDVSTQHDQAVPSVVEINDKLVEDSVHAIMGRISTVDREETLQQLQLKRQQLEKLQLELEPKQ